MVICRDLIITKGQCFCIFVCLEKMGKLKIYYHRRHMSKIMFDCCSILIHFGHSCR